MPACRTKNPSVCQSAVRLRSSNVHRSTICRKRAEHSGCKGTVGPTQHPHSFWLLPSAMQSIHSRFCSPFAVLPEIPNRIQLRQINVQSESNVYSRAAAQIQINRTKRLIWCGTSVPCPPVTSSMHCSFVWAPLAPEQCPDDWLPFGVAHHYDVIAVVRFFFLATPSVPKENPSIF